MRQMLCASVVVLVVTGLAPAVRAEAPVAMLHDSLPGLSMTFDDETSDMEWGKKERWSDGDWDYTGGSATAVIDEAWGRLRTTLKNDNENELPMPLDQDWVCSVVWTNNVGTNSTIFEAMSPGGDLVKFRAPVGTPEPGQTLFDVLAGDGSGLYVPVTQLDIPLGETHTVTLAYEAADGLLDFYLDDTLKAENFQSRSGNYDLFRLQILGGDFHVVNGETIDEIKIGLGGEPVIPTCNPGDADDDGDVDDDDLSLLLANWGAETDCAHGEFSGA